MEGRGKQKCVAVILIKRLSSLIFIFLSQHLRVMIGKKRVCSLQAEWHTQVNMPEPRND